MSRIVGGIGISHTPSMGTEFDQGMRGTFDPAWKQWFDGTRPVKGTCVCGESGPGTQRAR